MAGAFPAAHARVDQQLLDRYLRVRPKHPHAHSEWLWLGKKGRLTDTGVLQMLRRRGADAGLEHVYVHLLRHSFAHSWLASGGSEGDLMRPGGLAVARHARSL